MLPSAELDYARPVSSSKEVSNAASWAALRALLAELPPPGTVIQLSGVYTVDKPLLVRGARGLVLAGPATLDCGGRRSEQGSGQPAALTISRCAIT